MAPRAAPSRHDETARRFLDFACQLIDASLAPPGTPQPPRLKMLRYPATLEWLRVEDVFRLAVASGEAGLSRTAFFNRWSTKDEFLRDAVVYAFEFNPGRAAVSDPEQLDLISSKTSLSAGIIQIADGYIDGLLAYPRSFLLVHIGPLLDHHPDLRADLLESLRGTRAWFDGYAKLLTTRGLAFRPGWTVERLGLTIQAMLDGFLFRYRIQREDFAATRWENASLFADAIIAFCLGTLDTDGNGHTARRALDLAASSR